jgi:hypothetical protein
VRFNFPSRKRLPDYWLWGSLGIAATGPILAAIVALLLFAAALKLI